jgi:hypothetical protein
VGGGHGFYSGKGNGKVHLETGLEGPGREVDVKLYSFFNLGARWGGWWTCPGRFNPGKSRCPSYRGAGWSLRPVLSTENLSPTMIRNPDRPARSESLYLTAIPALRSTVIIELKKRRSLVTGRRVDLTL